MKNNRWFNFNKEFSRSVLLTSGSLILTFICLELAFRIINPVKFNVFFADSTKDWLNVENFLTPQVVRPSSTLGYEWLPNVRHGWFSTNSLGMLDKERQKNKPKGTYRIICVGDSTTATSGYVKTLEEILNHPSLNNQDKFEVWNCGVIGYNLIQYCQAIEEKWVECNPDMIIVGFCLNDFNTTPLIFRKGNKFVGYFPGKEILANVNPFFLRHSALYRFFVYRKFFSGEKKDWETIRAVSSKRLQGIKSLLAKKNIDLLIVILGFTKELRYCRSSFIGNYRFIKDLAQKYHIESVDTVPIFQEKGPGKFMYLDEIHFNQAGSKIVAQAIYDCLKRKQLIP